jgi:transcriptional regulator with XRE-family HTH domain
MGMKGTTNMMHRVMGVAVVALRDRMQWTQERLASRITKIGSRKAGGPRTYMQTISQWERYLESPSPSHRMALSKLAEKHGHPDLVAVFRATPEVALALVMNLWRPPKE